MHHTKPYHNLPSCTHHTEYYQDIPKPTKPYQTIANHTKPNQTIQNNNKPYNTITNHTNPCQTIRNYTHYQILSNPTKRWHTAQHHNRMIVNVTKRWHTGWSRPINVRPLPSSLPLNIASITNHKLLIHYSVYLLLVWYVSAWMYPVSLSLVHHKSLCCQRPFVFNVRGQKNIILFQIFPCLCTCLLVSLSHYNCKISHHHVSQNIFRL